MASDQSNTQLLSSTKDPIISFKMKIKTSTCNIAVACVVIFLVNSAFFPGSIIQNVVVSDSRSTLSKSNIGYHSQAIISITSIIGSLSCSFLHDNVGLKATYGLGIFLYCGLYIAVALLEQWALYAAAILTGLGVGIVWVMGPRIVADNSTNDRLLRNFSVFQLFMTSSIVVGSMWDYFYIEKLTEIGEKKRIVIYSVCTVITMIAAFFAILCVRHPDDSLLKKKREENEKKEKQTELTRYQLMLVMIKRSDFWFLVTYLFYCGMVTSYIWLTFTTCIGATFTKRGLIALAGIVIGVFEMIGVLTWERVGAKSLKACTVLLFLFATAANVLSFLTFPGDSPYNPTPDKSPYITPTTNTVLAISALLGFSESGFAVGANTCTGKVFSGYEDMGFILANVVWCGATGIMFIVGPLIDIQVFLALVQFMLVSTVVIKLKRLDNA